MKNNEMETLLLYQKKYGKRHEETWGDWILKKRSINSAAYIISEISGFSFDIYEQALYFPCTDGQRYFQRIYERQMEDALLCPENFVKNLDAFYRDTCLYIEKHTLEKNFFNFTEQLSSQRRKKIAQDKRWQAIFDAYISLVMQQAMYFCRDNLSKSIVGITESGDLMKEINPNPYIDAGSYELEKKLMQVCLGKSVLAKKDIVEAYRMYGYDFHSLAEVHACEALTRTFDNNLYNMVPFISERIQNIVIETPYQHFLPRFPRIWLDTEKYREKLKKRNYLLPAAGITARYVNAGDISEIRFAEILHNGEIVLLYRVITDGNGEYSGYYKTKSQEFYSIFEFTERKEWHDQVENFILENYMLLTCSCSVQHKRNYAIRQVDSFSGEFFFPYQVLATYSYYHRENRGKASEKCTRKYVKEEYLEEIRTRKGYLRRLPTGQRASENAVKNALSIGIELPNGMTYVRSHEYVTHVKNLF